MKKEANQRGGEKGREDGRENWREGERLFEERLILFSCNTDHFNFKGSQGGTKTLPLWHWDHSIFPLMHKTIKSPFRLFFLIGKIIRFFYLQILHWMNTKSQPNKMPALPKIHCIPNPTPIRYNKVQVGMSWKVKFS